MPTHEHEFDLRQIWNRLKPHPSAGPPPAPRVSTRGRPDSVSVIAALGQPGAYPRPTRRVDVAETHRSWVFLTGGHAYKMKKPVRFGKIDLTTPEERRRSCRNELELNQRLAAGVYLRVVPLARDTSGRLRIDGPGEIVDWLIEMLRLPRDRMLDERIREGVLTRAEIDALGRRLLAFYRSAPPAGVSPAAIRRRIWHEVRISLAVMRNGDEAVDGDEPRRIARGLMAFLRNHGGLLAERISGGRFVEGHGDLRPEHVCLLIEPVVIDCLEFSRELRLVDPVQEIAHLALECRLLGAEEVGERLLCLYRCLTKDELPPALVGFYQALHAFVRARLAFAHLLEPAYVDRERWLERTRLYLDLADGALAEAQNRLDTEPEPCPGDEDDLDESGRPRERGVTWPGERSPDWDEVDEAGWESFPASDPPAWDTAPTKPGG